MTEHVLEVDTIEFVDDPEGGPLEEVLLFWFESFWECADATQEVRYSQG